MVRKISVLMLLLQDGQPVAQNSNHRWGATICCIASRFCQIFIIFLYCCYFPIKYMYFLFIDAGSRCIFSNVLNTSIDKRLTPAGMNFLQCFTLVHTLKRWTQGLVYWLVCPGPKHVWVTLTADFAFLYAVTSNSNDNWERSIELFF